jgi:hypothetical protein
VLCGLYISKARELRALSTQQSMARYNTALFNQLANDVLEYSKTHPAIEPIIDTYLKPKTAGTQAAPAPAKPSKPASK